MFVILRLTFSVRWVGVVVGGGVCVVLKFQKVIYLHLLCNFRYVLQDSKLVPHFGDHCYDNDIN